MELDARNEYSPASSDPHRRMALEPTMEFVWPGIVRINPGNRLGEIFSVSFMYPAYSCVKDGLILDTRNRHRDRHLLELRKSAEDLSSPEELPRIASHGGPQKNRAGCGSTPVGKLEQLAWLAFDVIASSSPAL